MIYLDNAATTSVTLEVVEAMEPFATMEYGNPSSTHQFGRAARHAVEQARADVASWIGAQTNEVVFTSGGTESINAALMGVFLTGQSSNKKHFVTTAVEHHAVLHTCNFLQSLGASVTVVSPQSDGRIRVEDVVAAVREDTICVSVMSVNNELGTVEPVREVAQAVKQVNTSILVHSDMVQSGGATWFALSDSELDFASFSAHKLHGPKGVGALFIRRGTVWTSLIHGGEQEKARRAGTENVAGIVGFGAAARRLTQNRPSHIKHLQEVRDLFWDQLKNIPDVLMNSPGDAAPSVLNVTFPGIKAETLLIRLDLAGVMASSGSACSAGSMEPSHVLLACGLGKNLVHASVRFSFSDLTTPQDAVQAGVIVRDTVQSLRMRAVTKDSLATSKHMEYY